MRLLLLLFTITLLDCSEKGEQFVCSEIAPTDIQELQIGDNSIYVDSLLDTPDLTEASESSCEETHLFQCGEVAVTVNCFANYQGRYQDTGNKYPRVISIEGL